MLWPLAWLSAYCERACLCMAFVPLQQVAAMTSVFFPPARAHTNTHTHTHTHTHTLSLRRCVLSSVSPTRCYRVWNSPIISGGLTHAKTPARAGTHVRTYVSGNTARRTDLITQAERLNPTEERAPKKETRKEYKRLICPCCISVFHLPTLAYPHPHRLDPIASARASLSLHLHLATQTSTVWRNIAVEFFFSLLFFFFFFS